MASIPPVPPRDEQAPILAHEVCAPDHYLVRVHAPYIAANAAPGQFIQIRARPGLDPFLRRPFSISMANSEEGWVEFLYKLVGAGTASLSRRRVGETVAALGPLGHPFRLPETGTVFLAGGGVGMPPLHFAAHRLPLERIRVVQGAKTRALVLYGREFERLGLTPLTATEDGTAGVQGLITDVLGPALGAVDGPREILTCGPTPMMAAVARLAYSRQIACQVSLEERMACGFGVCMGCAVRTTSDSPSARYALVCADGPVFEAHEIFPPHTFDER